MVNPAVPNMVVNMNNIINAKDSRWLQLEVCREFQRNKCTRPDTECKFAHPPSNVDVQNGRVTACYDSIKGRCNRTKPPCKYFHPPQHLKDQLLINGRNHLAFKNAVMSQFQGISPAGASVVPGAIPMTSSPYLAMPSMAANFNPYIAAASSPIMTVGEAPVAQSPLTGMFTQAIFPAQKVARADRLEVCREFQRGACKRPEPECRFAHPPDHVTTSDDGTVTVCMDAVKSRCSRDPCRYFHPPSHLQAQLRTTGQSRSAQPATAPAGATASAVAAALPIVSSAPLSTSAATAATTELGKKRGRDPSDELLLTFPGVGIPYKRTAGDKSGVPVYQQTGNAAYHHALMHHLGGQSYVPVSCEYGRSSASFPLTVTGADISSPAKHNADASSPMQPDLSLPSSSSISPPSMTSPTNTVTTTVASESPKPAGSPVSTQSATVASGSLVPAFSQPSNVIPLTGYTFSNNFRTALKPQPSLPPTAVTPGVIPGGAALAASAFPSMLSHSSTFGYPSYPTAVTQAAVIPGMGSGLYGFTSAALTGGAPTGVTPMTGLGSGISFMSPSLVYPASSMVLHPYTALTNPSQTSLPQAGEQPFKKLKTS